MKVFSNDLTAKSLSVDATETTVCFASYSTIKVTWLYAITSINEKIIIINTIRLDLYIG